MDRKVGNYTIQGEIGKGGMATVFKAVQESLNRVVALKELDLARLKSEPNALERFRLEARAAAALDHPNIVTIYDLWEEEEKAYIAMEYIDGVELKNVLFNLGAIHFLNASLIAMAVSEALHYSHSKGMVHRDVKPGNIMLTANGEIRLMDFGIVSISGGGDLTISGQILGTPAYMSPEQIAGNTLGPQADLFSLGAVLYEMITGRKPFSGASHVTLIQDVLHGQPPLLHELDPEIPESISRAVQKCLEKSPVNRYSSMEEFSTVLEMVMPLDRPDSKVVVKRLVESTKEQERTKLHTNAGEGDRTSPQMMEYVELEAAAEKTTPSPARVPDTSPADKGDDFIIQDQGNDLYGLEDGPPVDLPPLEPDDGGIGDFVIESEPEKSAPEPLAFKEVPPQELPEETFPDTENLPVAAKRRTFLWLIPVLIIIAVAVWKFTGEPKPAAVLKRAVNPAMKAEVTVIARPAGRVFMDGRLIGNAKPSLDFEVKPGLHQLQVRLPRHEPKKFILDLKPGEKRKIEVKFGDR